MNTSMPTRLSCLVLAVALPLAGRASADVPAAIAAPGAAIIATFHAEGSQIYDCRANSGGKLVWQLREPIATLLLDGKTVGRHYAGPKWELADGSLVQGKVVGSAPGSTGDDIPWLKLEVAMRAGNGALSYVTTIQRINTHGGMAHGPCDKPGAFLSVAYHADYVFLGPAD
jgi:hypothetical protein